MILAAVATGLLSWDTMEEHEAPSWVAAVGAACAVAAVLGAVLLEGSP